VAGIAASAGDKAGIIQAAAVQVGLLPPSLKQYVVAGINNLRINGCKG